MSTIVDEQTAPTAVLPHQVPLLVLEVGSTLMAIALDRVRGVVPARPFTALPGAAAPVQGLINVRGRILTVIDLAAHLGHGPAADQPDHRVVIVDAPGRLIGMAVTDVLRIMRVLPEDLETGTADLDGRPVDILDPDSILQPIFE